MCVEVPHYFLENRFETIEKRNQTINDILERLKTTKDSTKIVSSENLLSTLEVHQNDAIPLSTAIHILQAHERARQGRIHAYFMRLMKSKPKNQEMKSISDHNLENNCLIIQTIWRQKYAQKLFNIKKTENAKLLGMVRDILCHLIKNSSLNVMM